MKKLPIISGKEVIKRLKKVGFVATRQRDDHVRMEKMSDDGIIKVTVSLHKEMKKGTLKQIINVVGLTKEAFNELK
jgi:predicted RNA binding protein YcfA (HicA-like mRNA interferase family)